MLLNVSFQRLNILDVFFLDSINLHVILWPFFVLWELAYGYDKKSTEPRHSLCCYRVGNEKSIQLSPFHWVEIFQILRIVL